MIRAFDQWQFVNWYLPLYRRWRWSLRAELLWHWSSTSSFRHKQVWCVLGVWRTFSFMAVMWIWNVCRSTVSFIFSSLSPQWPQLLCLQHGVDVHLSSCIPLSVWDQIRPNWLTKLARRLRSTVILRPNWYRQISQQQLCGARKIARGVKILARLSALVSPHMQ